MAADKKTLLREALKQVQAGKIDKAIETYRAIIKLDPRDAAVRNSVADLLGRQGKKKDAIAEYLEASTLYEKDGFWDMPLDIWSNSEKPEEDKPQGWVSVKEIPGNPQSYTLEQNFPNPFNPSEDQVQHSGTRIGYS